VKERQIPKEKAKEIVAERIQEYKAARGSIPKMSLSDSTDLAEPLEKIDKNLM